MTKCGILCGEMLFGCGLSDLWDFTKTVEDKHPLNCIVITISFKKRILTGNYMEGSAVL